MSTQIVEFTKEDTIPVVELLNEGHRNSFEFVPFDEERIKSQIRRRRLNILLAKEGTKVTGVIATHSHENSEMDISWLTAIKGSREKEVENMLVNVIENNPKVKIVVTSVDAASPKVADWIKRGYTLEPGFQRMYASLTGRIPVPNVAEGVKLRTLGIDEELEFITAVNAGFGWERLELGDLEIWKEEDRPFNEDWVQIAEVEGKIASTVVAKPDTDSIRYLHLNRGYLGPAATLREFRNMHLASALTARAMNFLFENGFDSARLGTSESNVSSNALLRRLGFQVVSVRKTMRKRL